jgi:hypothetical protein
MSQTKAVVSRLLDASRVPSGENASDKCACHLTERYSACSS